MARSSSLLEKPIVDERQTELTSGEVELNEREFQQLTQIKRFAERWSGDAEFRQLFRSDARQAIAKYDLKVDPEEVRFISEPESIESLEQQRTIVQKIAQIIGHSAKMAKAKVENYTNLSEARITAWRRRNRIRLITQMPKFNEQIGFFPAAFELSKGCSGKCWFCSVAAIPLQDVFPHTEENTKLWRQVLELMKDILGTPAAAESFCYWATDPLDNPDYEKFCLDFYEIMGNFPGTTTAQAAKNPTRTRNLLKLSQAKDSSNIRFSILSLKMLNQIHQEFTPEELAFVHLVLQNKEAEKPIKVNAGRARETKRKQPKLSSQFGDDLTNICVSGFLFNMVERSVKLISPCVADDRWPMGYRIHDRGNFSNIEELTQLLEEMISTHMPLTVKPEDLIRFRSDLHYESDEDGFQLSTQFKTFKFHNVPYLKELGELIEQGDKTAEEIASTFSLRGLPTHFTFRYLNQLWDKGLLEDEPFPQRHNSSARDD